MARRMYSLIVVIALAYAALCAVVFVFQRSFIYYPQPPTGNGRAETMGLVVEGARVLVTTRVRGGPKALIYFGGNAEDVAYSLPALATAFPDHSVYLMHYRGYGGSSGSPSEVALFADALALFDLIHATHAQVTVVGRSLGSGVATYLASQRPVERVVLVTPYDSMQELAARYFPYLPVRWLLRDKFESWKYATRIAVPTLIVAAEHDEVIPRANTEALLGGFRAGVATLKVVAGVGHNSISDSPEYITLLRGQP